MEPTQSESFELQSVPERSEQDIASAAKEQFLDGKMLIGRVMEAKLPTSEGGSDAQLLQGWEEIAQTLDFPEMSAAKEHAEAVAAALKGKMTAADVAKGVRQELLARGVDRPAENDSHQHIEAYTDALAQFKTEVARLQADRGVEGIGKSRYETTMDARELALDRDVEAIGDAAAMERAEKKRESRERHAAAQEVNPAIGAEKGAKLELKLVHASIEVVLPAESGRLEDATYWQELAEQLQAKGYSEDVVRRAQGINNYVDSGSYDPLDLVDKANRLTEDIRSESPALVEQSKKVSEIPRETKPAKITERVADKESAREAPQELSEQQEQAMDRWVERGAFTRNVDSDDAELYRQMGELTADYETLWTLPAVQKEEVVTGLRAYADNLAGGSKYAKDDVIPHVHKVADIIEKGA
ncbi:MAG: hypothetical protein HOE53_03965 [Candidatus Magasanikbacteria bacterium]|jgi:hypothetical protein|nr:hypothetical protein [Candidatus Magasanikbacteria bacterium]